MTVPTQIVRLLLFLGGRCRLSKMAFPLAGVQFLMLCVGRLLGLFGYSIGVRTMEHHADGSEVVLSHTRFWQNVRVRSQIGQRKQAISLQLAVCLENTILILQA